MLKRKIQTLLRSRLELFPAVCFIGPRQSGKTTLAKSLENSTYFDLENEGDRLNLDLQWDSLLSQSQLIVLDEAQEWPDLFKRLRGAIDSDRKRNGRFLLLGSVSPALMLQVSESLAGRMTLLELTPFLMSELDAEKELDLWLYGGYPDGGILNPKKYPVWQQSYLDLLVSRDLPHWGLSADAQTTMRLLKMTAVVHGQTVNLSQLGQSLGISYNTVKNYLQFLEGAFLLRQLQPFAANLKKRLVKSPKLYWRDSGLLHALMNVHGIDQLLHQPWVGAGWEGFVIEQIIGAMKLNDRYFTPYFFRTSDQHEIDLVLDMGSQLWAIEIKLTSAPALADIQKLNKAADMIGATRRILISRTSRMIESEKVVSCDLNHFLQSLNKNIGGSR